MKEVTILIPSRFNNRWVLDLNLRTIRKYTTCPYRIVIGDAGIDEETLNFLHDQKDVTVVQCPDPVRPKEHLARVVETPYFVFLHDDVQILKKGWLKRRVDMMENNSELGIVGVLGTNKMSVSRWKKLWFSFSPLNKRLFPLVMVVRKQVQDELDLVWGMRPPAFDTGGIAYLQFIKQKKWKFKWCKFNDDVKHWGEMTWVMKKREKTTLNMEQLRNTRDTKVSMIQDLVKQENY